VAAEDHCNGPQGDSVVPEGRAPADLYAGLSGAQVRLKSQLVAMRPELAAGGFPRDDGTVQFYTRVNALLSVDMTLLDFGAGRGRQFDIPDAGYREAIQKFQGKVAKVIGVDVYDGIQHHPHLDERHVIDPGAALPLQSGTIDIVVADWVFEHLENPDQFAREMERIVRPGGWVCARTVNRWGYVGIGARIIPNSVHARIVRRLIPVARSADVFPVHYRANSLRDIQRSFSTQNWENFSYLVNTTPRYYASSRTLFRMMELYQKFTPYKLGVDLFIFLRRR
jgi:SAM-dependent methyltransferase